MNTMADGAAQRRVAQIGEALFGQPGLTLMELAEKVKGMRSPFLIEEEPLPADMRLGSADYLDYLNDQPSPDGQGDARDIIAEFVQCADAGRPPGKLLAQARDFLAASQPVEFERAIPTRRRESAVELLLQLGFVWDNQQWEDRRQPVGQEPVGYARPEDLVADGFGHTFTVYQSSVPLKATAPLYAAVPAQAVDQGEMPQGWRLSKKANCYQLSHGNDIVGNLVGPDAEENAAIIARVLDSKAVGK